MTSVSLAKGKVNMTNYPRCKKCGKQAAYVDKKKICGCKPMTKQIQPKIVHVNPNCTDSSMRKPHGERGSVEYLQPKEECWCLPWQTAPKCPLHGSEASPPSQEWEEMHYDPDCRCDSCIFIRSLLARQREELREKIREMKKHHKSESYVCPKCRHFMNVEDNYCGIFRTKLVTEVHEWESLEDENYNLALSDILSLLQPEKKGERNR